MEEKMKSKGTGLSRRDFLKGASAGAVGIATAGILGGCAPKVSNPSPAATVAPTEAAVTPAAADQPWYGTAPEIADNQIAETVETEILICGAGHTGTISALAAAEQGAKILVIEKNPTPGRIKSWVGAVDTKAQIASGVKFNKTELVNDLARYARNYCDQRLIKTWADHSGETVDWLAGILAQGGITHVAEYDIGDGMTGVFKRWPTQTKFMAPEGKPQDMTFVTDAVVAKSKELGAEYRFETPLVKFVTDNSGKVTGAIAKKKDGTYLKINASKGILLCTGGYVNDLETYQKLNPVAASVTTRVAGQPGNTGDGIRAGIWAGGIKDVSSSAMLFDRGIVKPGGKAGYPFKEENAMFVVGSQPFLKVTLDGERFCNESAPYDFPLYAAGKEKGGVSCMIWDANYWTNVVSFHTIGCSRLDPSPSVPKTLEGQGKEGTEKLIAGMVEKGFVVQADTIEELAGKLKIPADALKATVARYNEIAKAGVDDDFGKPAKDLFSLETAPFYGATMGGWNLTTIDGLRINTFAQALNADLNVIPGLYVSGDCSGGFFDNNYPELVVGVACGRSMTFGRRAVLHMLGKL
jgi:fumarate reductase flavoprotein subunit